MIIKRDCYYIPENIFFDCLPLTREYGSIFMLMYIGINPIDYFQKDFIDKAIEHFKSVGILEYIPNGIKLNTENIKAQGSAVEIDFIEIARKKAEAKVKMDSTAGKLTADTLYALFSKLYIELRGVPYKESPLAKEKGMLANLIKEYGADRSTFVIDKGVKSWKLLSNKPLTIENLYGIRADIPYNPAWRNIDARF